jgi:hypothetical protein
MTTPTLGDFLTLAGQRIAAAAHYTGELPVAVQAGIVTQLGRLLTVMAKYARDGVQPAGAEPPAPVPTRQELTGLGIRITLEQAAASIHLAAQVPGIGASTGHPVTGHLRAAADCLLAGRDLLNTHDAGASGYRTDPLWAPVLTARPVTAALMRELSGYALHLWYLTARLSRPAAGTPIPPTAQEAIWDTARWLAYASSPSTSEHNQAGCDAGRLLLYSIPANLPPPRSPAAASAATAAELTAGVAATATRLRHLALRPGQDPRWPPASAAACWRHNALAAAIIGHNGELILRALTDRARQLAVHQHHHASLRLSAGTMRAAWHSWQAVTHAWDTLTAGTSRQLPPTAAELDDLVLWIGRLARGSTWTPARSNACPPRPPADLTPAPADIAAIAGAVALATDAITLLARHDLRSANQAGLAGMIYSPARLLPESDDLTHIYRYHRASADQLADLHAAYDHAITTTGQAATTLNDVLTATSAPGGPYALARSLQASHPAQPRQQASKPWTSSTPIAAVRTPGAGDVERVLHDLKVSDPELVLRAIALDHAARELTAEALTTAQRRTHVNREAEHAPASHSNNRRKASAQLAAQDLPDIRGGLTLTQPAKPVRADPADAGQRKRLARP